MKQILKISSIIHQIRGQSVILDNDLAKLYRVPTGRLNEAVKRKRARFPPDFMFQLTNSEYDSLISQIAISKKHGGLRKSPYVFTEQGVAMLSGILNSDIAIEVNIQIMRAFVKMRRFSLTSVDLKRKIDGMEEKYDSQFKIVFDALRQLLKPASQGKKSRGMGFTAEK